MSDTKLPAAAGDEGETKSQVETGMPADSPKRQGDKLGVGASAEAAASELGRTGDSSKRHGDELAHAVTEAAKG